MQGMIRNTNIEENPFKNISSIFKKDITNDIRNDKIKYTVITVFLLCIKIQQQIYQIIEKK